MCYLTQRAVLFEVQEEINFNFKLHVKGNNTKIDYLHSFINNLIKIEVLYFFK